METLVFSLTFAAISFAVFLVARIIDKRITIALAAICAIYLGLDDLVTALPSGNNAFAFINCRRHNHRPRHPVSTTSA